MGVRAVHTGGCDVNVSEYSKGRYRVLLANRRSSAGVEKVTYPLNGSWHHYDSIKHTYLGRNGKAEFALKGYDVKMLILTRNKLQDPRLKGMVKKGQFVITSGSDSGVWFARLFCDGKELKSLSRNVILDRNGKVEFNFGIAPKGKCEVRLLNIMNGKTFNFKADF